MSIEFPASSAVLHSYPLSAKRKQIPGCRQTSFSPGKCDRFATFRFRPCVARLSGFHGTPEGPQLYSARKTQPFGAHGKAAPLGSLGSTELFAGGTTTFITEAAAKYLLQATTGYGLDTATGCGRSISVNTATVASLPTPSSTEPTSSTNSR